MFDSCGVSAADRPSAKRAFGSQPGLETSVLHHGSGL